jgi:hypothetical protein
MFDFNWTVSVGWCLILFRTDVRIPSNSVLTERCRKKMSTKRRVKLARTFLGASLLVLIGTGFSTVSNASDTADVKYESKYVQVVLLPGESLWSIAEVVAQGGSIRSVVEEILAVNHLANADVAAGTKLMVPTR